MPPAISGQPNPTIQPTMNAAIIAGIHPKAILYHPPHGANRSDVNRNKCDCCRQPADNWPNPGVQQEPRFPPPFRVLSVNATISGRWLFGLPPTKSPPSAPEAVARAAREGAYLRHRGPAGRLHRDGWRQTDVGVRVHRFRGARHKPPEGFCAHTALAIWRCVEDGFDWDSVGSRSTDSLRPNRPGPLRVGLLASFSRAVCAARHYGASQRRITHTYFLVARGRNPPISHRAQLQVANQLHVLWRS